MKSSFVIDDHFISFYFSGIIMIKTRPALPTPPIIFTIDKPFIFAIVHGATNTVLFQGRVDSPTL